MGAGHNSAAHAGPDKGEQYLLVDAESHAHPRSILWLGEPACHDPFLVGGKAASLSRLAAHYPVPPGFALTTSAFDLAAGADPSMDGDTAPMLPAELRADAAAAYRLLEERCAMDAPAVAVRSSAVDEDGRDASFAGQHETFLNVAGVDALMDAISRCWASFYTPHAIDYRRRQGLAIEGVRVAVLVQQLVLADAAAVVFSADPVTGSRGEVVVNASWGLGESIVGGIVTPDTYRVRRQDLAVSSRWTAEKRRMTVAVPGRTTEVDVPAFLRRRPALTDEQALAMARLALALEAMVGRPVDIECAYHAGRLYLLQCRPITTLGDELQLPDVVRNSPLHADPPPRAAPPPRGIPIETPPAFPVTWQQPDDERLLWTLDRVHWPDPLPLLVFAIAGDALAGGLTAAAVAYELPIAEVRIRRINTYRYQANVPVVCSRQEAEARRVRSQQKLRAAMARLAEVWMQEWLPEVKEHLAYWEGCDLGGIPLAALLAHLDRTMDCARRLWEIHFLLASPMHGAISQFGKLYRELFGCSALDAYRLLEGFDNKILQAGRALWHLSQVAMALPEVRAIIENHPQGALAALEHSAHGHDFLVALQSYLKEYGQRGEGLSLDRPSWIEDPAPVLESLKDVMALAGRDLPAEMAATRQERERLVAAARRSLDGYPAPVRAEFEFLLAAAQQAVVLSEDHNFWIDACAMYQVRRVFLEFGQRFAAAGVLEEPQDVFALTLDELRETAHELPRIDRHALVAERRAEMECFRSISPPEQLGQRLSDGHAGRLSQSATERDVLHGNAGSSGVARGPARVVRTLAEAGKLSRGDILVAETLSSSWTPLFATVAAVVTDTGGILSHAAVVAREYRIPAVLGTDVATALLRDGQLLDVDGDRGTVRLISSG